MTTLQIQVPVQKLKHAQLLEPKMSVADCTWKSSVSHQHWL